MSLDPQLEYARRQLVRTQGPRAAAWLIWIARAKLHAAGAVDFHFRPGEKEPRYFLFAIALLRMRSKTWTVEVASDPDGSKDYRVGWRGWHTNGPRYRMERAVRKQQLARSARNALKRARRRFAL